LAEGGFCLKEIKRFCRLPFDVRLFIDIPQRTNINNALCINKGRHSEIYKSQKSSRVFLISTQGQSVIS
jgi:hypothetical protein